MATKLLGTVCFALPRVVFECQTGGHRRSLASRINLLIGEESDPTPDQLQPVPERRNNRPDRDPLETLAARVSAKLEDGDFKGAVRLASSEDSIGLSCQKRAGTPDMQQ